MSFEGEHLRHAPDNRCAFCQARTRISPAANPTQYLAALDALWDRAERATRLHSAYGKKHRR